MTIEKVFEVSHELSVECGVSLLEKIMRIEDVEDTERFTISTTVPMMIFKRHLLMLGETFGNGKEFLNIITAAQELLENMKKEFSEEKDV